MAKAIVSAAQLREILEYDPTSHSGLRWKVDHGLHGSGAKAGDCPGTALKGRIGYTRYVLNTAGRQWYAHRVVWMIAHGDIPDGMVIDHINGDPMDNRIENLRCVTIAINSRNQYSMLRNKTGFVGVSLDQHNNQYVASWHEEGHKLKQRRFSIRRLGEAEAFRLARLCRIEMMDRMQSMGAGYTDRHLSRSA